MINLTLAFKNKTQKITVPRSINPAEISKIISHTFGISQRIIGMTNNKGNFITLSQLAKNISAFKKDLLFIVAAQDIKQNATKQMSFTSETDYLNKKQQKFNKQLNAKFGKKSPQKQQLQIHSSVPEKTQGFYLGVIGSLQLFQQLFLSDQQATVVFCFVKQKPRNVIFPYYLYHTDKNAASVYVRRNKICEFCIQNMEQIPKQIQLFIRSLIKIDSALEEQVQRVPQIIQNQSIQQNQEQDLANEAQFSDEQQQNNQNQSEERDQEQEDDDLRQERKRMSQVRSSLLENLLKLRDDQQITELQFYRMKSELLESMDDFMRKYQIGSRKGFRRDANLQRQTKQRQRDMGKRYSSRDQVQPKQTIRQKTPPQSSKGNLRHNPSREQRRTKKYQIPIIVRKYNNVIEKISTSYPLSHEQEQSINLILELQLKGLISEKQAGVYKSSILQQDPEVYPLFTDYFNNLIDQIQLVSTLKKIKKIISEKKERGEHNMRLLMKHSKQCNYQILRNLILDNNHHLINSLEKYRADKNAQLLNERLQKIADFYRRKVVLEDILD